MQSLGQNVEVSRLIKAKKAGKNMLEKIIQKITLYENVCHSRKMEKSLCGLRV